MQRQPRKDTGTGQRGGGCGTSSRLLPPLSAAGSFDNTPPQEPCPPERSPRVWAQAPPPRHQPQRPGLLPVTPRPLALTEGHQWVLAGLAQELVPETLLGEHRQRDGLQRRGRPGLHGCGAQGR